MESSKDTTDIDTLIYENNIANKKRYSLTPEMSSKLMEIIGKI